MTLSRERVSKTREYTSRKTRTAHLTAQMVGTF